MENLGIDLKLIIAQIVSFAIFYFIFQRFISKPLLKFLKKQKEDEELRAKLAEELEDRKATLDEKDRKMNEDRKKALDIALIQGKKDAEKVKNELIEDAKKQAEVIITRAKEQVEDKKKDLYKDVRKKIAQVSVMLVESALKDYLTIDSQKAITENISKKIPQIDIE
ncbi:hypothetical protein CO051_05270 [Candidatus Roizmanbacteria bacterium CG_4_9_14_0_2_um_filter_39_13]|uniref:ATP synthase subunit b n=1 Tax=Candidatus Roizmanbacteria bacterium CG_4_9_14_0_2_um_filter_39_13 TaxID=1974839 RepID=A0A2M8EXC9_9BACT|nr:MAG: hypothetical protein COY15_03210 [Candidatus Roizmanbacteria bacterium CG_4_10_14_0_2_um_filter_39_12]PJC30536.1 MAG: hypothetical protein CO051_05270 [Candidatus Roizmanbacteria bacterium CG_4_9_14_0_2_um_filter_39_13]